MCDILAHLLNEPKAVSIEWGSEQKKFLSQVQASIPAVLSLGPYDPADSIMFKVSVGDRDAIWGFW